MTNPCELGRNDTVSSHASQTVSDVPAKYSPSAESTVSETGNVVSETGSHDERSRLQHLGHTYVYHER